MHPFFDALPAALSFGEKLYQNFIEKDRWQYYLQGLQTTLIITILAGILGVIIGLIVATVKISAPKSKNIPLKILDKILSAYLAFFRGTPMMVQLALWAVVIFASSPVNRIWVCVIAFGVNSGAYSAETFRAGILAVDKGQTEAGRSLGLSSFATYRYIVLPQAIKNILPPLLNEFIALLKETSIVTTIGMFDLFKAYQSITSVTFEFFIPLMTIALIYFIIVLIMNFIVKKVERRMARSDNR